MNEGATQRILCWLKRAAIVLATVHLLLATFLVYNRVTSRVMFRESDAWHMLYYSQFAEGGHMYYEPELKRTSDGYTPFSSQLFGWVMRIFGYDVRFVRFTVALFGAGALWLIALCVYRLTRDKFLAYMGAGLAAGMEPLWVLDLGPNTVHVFFALLGVYLLIRYPRPSWKAAMAAVLALFACYWSKQTGLAYMAAGLFYLFVREPKKGMVGLMVSLVLFVGTAIYFMNLESSRFFYLVFEWNREQPIIVKRLWDPIFFPIFFGRFSMLLLSLFGGLLCMKWRWPKIVQAEYVFLGAAAVAGLYAALKYGSGMAQAWVLYTLIIIVGLAHWRKLCRLRQWTPMVATILLVIQSLALAQDFRKEVITREDEQRYAHIKQLLSMPGRTMHANNLGYVNKILGKESFRSPYFDCWDRGTYRPEKYPKVWRDFLQTDPFDLIIVDWPPADGSFVLVDRLKKSYELMEEIPPDSRNNNAGYLRRKNLVFRKKGSTP